MITATEYDPRDGPWVYSTTDKAGHNQTKAKSALLQNLEQVSTLLLQNCLIASYVTSIKDLVGAGLMLDVIKTLPKSGRSNEKKFHQILDNILSHT